MKTKSGINNKIAVCGRVFFFFFPFYAMHKYTDLNLRLLWIIIMAHKGAAIQKHNKQSAHETCTLFHEFLGLPAGTDALLWISSFLGFLSSKLLSQCLYKVCKTAFPTDFSVVPSKFRDSTRTCTKSNFVSSAVKTADWLTESSVWTKVDLKDLHCWLWYNFFFHQSVALSCVCVLSLWQACLCSIQKKCLIIWVQRYSIIREQTERRGGKGERQHNPSSCELCVAVRQCCKDKFNLVRGFSPLSGWLYFVNV